ncbi:MAG: DUF4238 domain-containing protein, partial [Terriglobia bacterium]
MSIIAGVMPKRKRPTRKEHIVPRLVLANFSDDDGVLWVYAKGRPVRPSVPAKECCEHDFYE